MDGNTCCITSVAASIAAALGIEAPAHACAPDPRILDVLGGRKADRVLMYNPDAVALWIARKYPEKLIPVRQTGAEEVPMLSVMPSVTPVCFASMYTGAMPDVHGIQAYVKPVLACDTIFDAALRAHLRTAIVSTAGDSMSLIFLERKMDYYIYPSVEEVNDKAEELLKQDAYDLLIVYNKDYDANMHRTGPESEASLAALEGDANTFVRLEQAAKKGWEGKRALLAFAPDHGCHEIDGQLGSHGLDMPEDMNVIHFYKTIG